MTAANPTATGPGLQSRRITRTSCCGRASGSARRQPPIDPAAPPGPWLSFWLIHLRPGPFTGGPERGRGRLRGARRNRLICAQPAEIAPKN
jgi:hypothetical protein